MLDRKNKIHGHSFDDYYGLYESYMVNLVKESNPHKEEDAQQLVEAKRIVEMHESNPDGEAFSQQDTEVYHYYKGMLTTHGDDGRIKEFWELREPIYNISMSLNYLSDNFVYSDQLFNKEKIAPEAITELKSRACYKTLEKSPLITKAYNTYKKLPNDSLAEYERTRRKKGDPELWKDTLDEIGFICTIAAHVAHYMYDKEKRKELSDSVISGSEFRKMIAGDKRNSKRKGAVVETLELIEWGYGLKLNEENLMLKNLLHKLLSYAENGKVPPYFTEPYSSPIKRLILRAGSRYYKRSGSEKSKICLMVEQIISFVLAEAESASDDNNKKIVKRTMETLYDHIRDLETERQIKIHNREEL